MLLGKLITWSIALIILFWIMFKSISKELDFTWNMKENNRKLNQWYNEDISHERFCLLFIILIGFTVAKIVTLLIDFLIL